MDTTEVFRIEHPKTEYGPYQSGNSYEELYGLAQIMSDIHRDRPIMHKEGYVCGLSSIADTKEWFGNFIDDLTKLGYKLYKYEVLNDYTIKAGIVSNHQILFDKDNGTETRETLDISILR